MRREIYGAAVCLALTACNQAPRAVQATAPQAPVQGRVALAANSPMLARIRVEAVRAREFPIDEVVAPGKVEANAHRVARLTVPVAGRVREVYARLGETVREGQPLLAVDSVEAGAALAAWRQAQAQMRTARSALAKAQADLARLRELHQHRAAALKDVLAAENDATQAQSGVELSQAASDEAVQRLELLGLKPDAPSHSVIVRAPLSGKVLEIAVAPGEYRNDTNAPLMTIADLSTVWIAADVPESMIRHVSPGEAVEVTLSAYPGEKFRARVARIADVVDPQSRTVKVQAEIQNPAGRLRPEMFGEMRHSHAVRALPALPATALLQLDGRNAALVEAAPGTFREAVLEIGPPKGDLVPVFAGLKEGDRVVVDGAMLLKK